MRTTAVDRTRKRTLTLQHAISEILYTRRDAAFHLPVPPTENLVAKIQHHSGVVMEGETARLRCDVSGYPPPSVTWEKDGVAVTSESAKLYVQGDNTLVVPRVGIEDAGLYTCVAKNDMGTAKDLTYLQVKLQSE